MVIITSDPHTTDLGSQDARSSQLQRGYQEGNGNLESSPHTSHQHMGSNLTCMNMKKFFPEPLHI